MNDYRIICIKPPIYNANRVGDIVVVKKGVVVSYTSKDGVIDNFYTGKKVGSVKKAVVMFDGGWREIIEEDGGIEMKKQIKKHDGCDKCKYEYESCNLDPCYSCKQSHAQPNSNPDLWEDAREEIKEPLSVETNPIRPNHYKGCSIECIDAMILAFGAEAVAEFCIMNAFKYIWRYKDKNGLEDLNKAERYIGMSAELNGDMKKVESFAYMINKLREALEDGEEN